jgi:hypothetical protein
MLPSCPHGATKQRQGLGEPHAFYGRVRFVQELIKLWISMVPLALHAWAATKVTKVPMKGQNGCVTNIKLAGKMDVRSSPKKKRSLQYEIHPTGSPYYPSFILHLLQSIYSNPSHPILRFMPKELVLARLGSWVLEWKSVSSSRPSTVWSVGRVPIAVSS